MKTIQKIYSNWILDSRGLPTLQTQVTIDGSVGVASVPSGASTGSYEALELRDGTDTFLGKHVLKAIDNVNEIIANALVGKSFDSVLDLEKALLNLDTSENKSILGANAILSVSLASNRAWASAEGLELYTFLNKTYFNSLPLLKMPRLMCNVINGGAHADSGLAIQEFMIVPKTGGIETDVRAASEVYHVLKNSLKDQGFSIALGDEGGFAPHIETSTQVLDNLVTAIDKAGYMSSCELAMDCAASEFYDLNTRSYKVDGKVFSSGELVAFYQNLVKTYPLISIEDGFWEDDFEGWEEQTSKMGATTHLIGDDLFVTNPKRFKEVGIGKGLANGILIKPNQIGSVLETCQVMNDAKQNGYITIVSHRSGETVDTFISDLAYASQSEFIKLGAPARGERVAKYNRLLEIKLP